MDKQLTFLDLAKELRNGRHFQDLVLAEEQPLLVLFTCDKVKLLWIQKNGTVSNVRSDYKLQIIRTTGDSSNSCVLQILTNDGLDKCVWMYPLVPNVSPCLPVGQALVFPDLFSTDDSSIAIFIDDEVAFHTLSKRLFGPRPDATDSVAEHILKVAFIVSKHCIENAERTNSLISKGTAEFIKTVPKPEMDLKLPKKLMWSLGIAKATSELTLDITNSLVRTIQVIKIGLSHYLARQMAKHGNQLVPGPITSSQFHDKRLEEILEICVSLQEAHTTIEKGLSEAVAVVKKSLNENSLVLVEHIYGQPTAQAIREIIDTKHNGEQVAANLKRIMMMTPKGVAKQVLTSAGKEALGTVFGGKRKVEGGDSTDSCASTSKKIRCAVEENSETEDDYDDEQDQISA